MIRIVGGVALVVVSLGLMIRFSGLLAGRMGTQEGSPVWLLFGTTLWGILLLSQGALARRSRQANARQSGEADGNRPSTPSSVD